MSTEHIEIDEHALSDLVIERSAVTMEVAAEERRKTELAEQCELGMTLRMARRGAFLSQTELASMIGVAQSALSLIESGRRPLSVAMLRRFATALELNLALKFGTHRVMVTPAA